MFAETPSLVTVIMISDIFNSQGNGGGWVNEQGPPAPGRAPGAGGVVSGAMS